MRSLSRLCLPGTLFLTFCVSLRAQWIPVARMDVESLQSFTLGVSAFCRCAEIPFGTTDLNLYLSRKLAIPNLTGVNVREPIALHLLIDGSTPRTNAAFASLAVVPLTDNGVALLRGIHAEYTLCGEHLWGLVFSVPREGSAVCRQLAVSIRGGKAYVSETPDTLVWAAKAGRPVVTASAPFGQFVVTFNPSELAACLSASRLNLPTLLPPLPLLPTNQIEHAFARLPALLKETESLSLTFEAGVRALNTTLNIGFKADSPLRAWTARLRQPDRRYNGLVPPAATLATIVNQSDRGGWTERLGWSFEQQIPSLGSLVGDRQIEDSLSYFNSTRSGEGLAFFTVARTRDPKQTAQLLARNLTGAKLPSGIRVLREANRLYAGIEIQCYSLTNTLDAARITDPNDTASILPALARLMSRVTMIESAFIGQDLVLVVGPQGAIETVIADLKSEKPPYPPLLDRCRQLSQDLPPEAAAVIQFGPVATLRRIVSILPGYKASQLEYLVRPGDGLVVWARQKDGKYVGSLCLAANEVVAIQQALARGRPILQELLMQMVMQQVLGRDATEHDSKAPQP